jgi:hypothetical protein
MVSPSHGRLAMSGESDLVDWFDEYVGGLEVRLNCLNGDISVIDITSEMVVLDIDVLGSWTHLRYRSDLYRPTVVFEDLAVEPWVNGRNVVSSVVEFLEQVHDGTSCTECIG